MTWVFAEARTKEITFLGASSCVTQQTCLLCHTANMSAVSHSMTCLLYQAATQQSCLLCRTADMSVVSRSNTAVMSDESESRHVCCVAQQVCLLCPTAGISAVSHSGIRKKRNYLSYGLPRTAKVIMSSPQAGSHLFQVQQVKSNQPISLKYSTLSFY